MFPYPSDFGNYITKTFCDTFENVTEFIEFVKNSEVDVDMQESSLTTLYYLLYGNYGNSSWANPDETQSCYKMLSIIFMYGPTWEKRIQIQKEVRAMTINDAISGGRSINNQSSNPSTKPTTSTMEELLTIDNQYVNRFEKSKVDGYAYLMTLLKTDVTKEFLDRFKVLFIAIVAPQEPLYYETELEN